ncbi:MAG: hypothetical protein ACREL5_14615, partial [Gemmatimonadales bacterium]
MSHAIHRIRPRQLTHLIGAVLWAGVAHAAAGQGCMPLHFTTPGLGGEAITFLHRGQWQVGVAGRRVATNRFYVG